MLSNTIPARLILLGIAFGLSAIAVAAPAPAPPRRPSASTPPQPKQPLPPLNPAPEGNPPVTKPQESKAQQKQKDEKKDDLPKVPPVLPADLSPKTPPSQPEKRTTERADKTEVGQKTAIGLPSDQQEYNLWETLSNFKLILELPVALVTLISTIVGILAVFLAWQRRSKTLSLTITCSFCGAKHGVPENALGCSFKCPKCSNRFTLAAPASLPPDPPNRTIHKPPVLSASPSPSAINRTILAQLEATIRYSCPQCKKSLESPASLAGQKLNCPDCGQRLQIPAAVTLATMPVVDKTNFLPVARESQG